MNTSKCKEDAKNQKQAEANTIKAQKQKQAKRERIKKLSRRAMVRRGLKPKTKGGLEKDDLIVNRNGKIVSLRKSEQCKRNDALQKWRYAAKAARVAMGFGNKFEACRKGTDLYAKTMEIYKSLRDGTRSMEEP